MKLPVVLLLAFLALATAPGGATDLGGLAVRGRRVFYLKRAGPSQRPVLYLRDASAPGPRMVLDGDRLSPDSSTILAWWQPSRDGLLLSYGVARLPAGDVELRVREVDSVTDLPDRISHTPEASVAWLPNRSGFYYLRRGDAGQEGARQRVYFHTLGTDTAYDHLVFGGLDASDRIELQVSEDGALLVLFLRSPVGGSSILIHEREAAGAGLVPVSVMASPSYRALLSGRTLYLLTEDNASRGRMVTVDLRRPRRPVRRELMLQGPLAVMDFALARDGFAAAIAENSVSRLQWHDRAGRPVREIPVPREGSVTALAADPGRDDIFFIWESFFSAPVLYRYNVRTSSLTALDSLPGPAPEEFKLRRVELSVAKGGASIPMFLVSQPRFKRDGTSPTILTGLPRRGLAGRNVFSSFLVSWLQKGGLWAAPILSGGETAPQEEGDALVAAGRWLAAGEYTRTGRLALLGCGREARNAAAAAAQAPDLFAATILDQPPAGWPRQRPMPPALILAGPCGAELPRDRQIAEEERAQAFLLQKMGVEKSKPSR